LPQGAAKKGPEKGANEGVWSGEEVVQGVRGQRVDWWAVGRLGHPYALSLSIFSRA